MKIQVELQYSTDISVNRKYISRKFNKNPKYKAYQNLVQNEIIKTGKCLSFNPKKKVYISCMVYRPDMRADVCDNFTKGIIDAIKEVITVNDNWYAIKFWDWEVDKQFPRLILTIEQDDD